MLAVWRGGIRLLGGIAGAILINVPRVRRYGYRFFQVMDPAAVALAMGIAIGRIGDLVDRGSPRGKPTSWALAWTYHGGTLAPPWACSGRTLRGRTCSTAHARSCSIGRGATPVRAHGQVLSRGVGVHQTALVRHGQSRRPCSRCCGSSTDGSSASWVCLACVFGLLVRLRRGSSHRLPAHRQGVLRLFTGSSVDGDHRRGDQRRAPAGVGAYAPSSESDVCRAQRRLGHSASASEVTVARARTGEEPRRPSRRGAVPRRPAIRLHDPTDDHAG